MVRLVIVLFALAVLAAQDAEANKLRPRKHGTQAPALNSSAGGGGSPTDPPCTHYASPTASSGQPGTSSNPFRPVDFWSVSSIIGKTLCLKDGTYQGANFMINPPDGLSGTDDTHRVNVRAEND